MRNKLLAMAVFAGIMIGASAASAQGVHLFAALNGGNEVTGGGAANAGDPNGWGTAHVMFAGAGRICFGISVFALSTPTGAHIHEAKAGTNAPIAIALTTPDAGSPGSSSGCVSGIDSALLNRLRAMPSNFYVNVHTTQFPAGAVRGQLF